MSGRVFIATNSKKCSGIVMPLYGLSGKKEGELVDGKNRFLEHPNVKTPDWYTEFKSKIKKAIYG